MFFLINYFYFFYNIQITTSTVKPVVAVTEFEFATKIQIILIFCDNFNNFFDVPNIQM